MPDCAVGLFVRSPHYGRVKTRLAHDIGEDYAYEIYITLLTNAVNLAMELDSSEYLRSVFVTPSETIQSFKENYSGFDMYNKQVGADLGMRMFNAIQTLLDNPVVNSAMLFGADIPDLNDQIIRKAHDELKSNDMVIGPTFDGGYYLIGLKENCKDLFSGINWGSSEVLEDTLLIAEDLNLRVAMLKKLYDLDEIEDLKHFENYKHYLK